MKFYNKLKFFIRLSLMCAIMFDMIVIFEAVMRNNTYILYLFLLYLFIIPLIFLKSKNSRLIRIYIDILTL